VPGKAAESNKASGWFCRRLAVIVSDFSRNPAQANRQRRGKGGRRYVRAIPWDMRNRFLRNGRMIRTSLL
jgi:hypothetical protein